MYMNKHLNQLENAVRSGQISLVEKLLQEFPEIVNLQNQEEELPIEIALASGNAPMVRCLLDHGAELTRVGSMGSSVIEDAFYYAFFEDNRVYLKCLLDTGFNPNYQRTGPEDVPLVSRAALCDLEALRLVLSYGPDINRREGRGWTALMFACAFDIVFFQPEQAPEMIQLLLDAGADPLIRNTDRHKMTAREIAEMQSTADNPYNAKAIEILREAERNKSD